MAEAMGISPTASSASCIPRRELRQHFSEKEISVITATVAMINLWNRIQISRH